MYRCILYTVYFSDTKGSKQGVGRDLLWITPRTYYVCKYIYLYINLFKQPKYQNTHIYIYMYICKSFKSIHRGFHNFVSFRLLWKKYTPMISYTRTNRLGEIVWKLICVYIVHVYTIVSNVLLNIIAKQNAISKHALLSTEDYQIVLAFQYLTDLIVISVVMSYRHRTWNKPKTFQNN